MLFESLHSGEDDLKDLLDARSVDPLSASSTGALARIKDWFRSLVKSSEQAGNPAADLELPRVPQVLSVAEVEIILAQPDVETALGLRDRALPAASVAAS